MSNPQPVPRHRPSKTYTLEPITLARIQAAKVALGLRTDSVTLDRIVEAGCKALKIKPAE